MNSRMKDYIRRETAVGVEIMLRDDTAFHAFDLDDKGQLVFFMAVVPKQALASLERLMSPSAPLRAETPVRREPPPVE